MGPRKGPRAQSLTAESYYRLDLFTNFRLFLKDPVNGDGIQQADRRVMYGGDAGYTQPGEVLGLPSIGMGPRRRECRPGPPA